MTMCCDLVLVHDRAFKDVHTDVHSTNNIHTAMPTLQITKFVYRCPHLIDIHFYTPINVLPTSLARQINMYCFLASHTLAYVTYHEINLLIAI